MKLKITIISFFLFLSFSSVFSQNFEFQDSSINFKVNFVKTESDGIDKIVLTIGNKKNHPLLILSGNFLTTWLAGGVLYVEMRTNITDPFLIKDYKLDFQCVSVGGNMSIEKDVNLMGDEIKEVQFFVEILSYEKSKCKRKLKIKRGKCASNEIKIRLSSLTNRHGELNLDLVSGRIVK